MSNVYYERGVQLYSIARYQDAINSFEQALSISPDDTDVKYHLALCFFVLDQEEKAEKIALSILETDPDDGHVHFLLSKIYTTLDQDKKAKKHNDIAISLDPYEANFFGQRAYILMGEKKYEQGVIAADEGLKLEPNNEYCLNAKVQLLTKLGRQEEAEIITETLLENDAENVFSHANIGWVELENQNYDKAFTHFTEALRLNPNFEYAREGMSTALKAKNFLYRLYLKYSFWMGKQTGKRQWAVIIAIYFIYRVSVKMLSAAQMDYLVIPVIIFYMFFVLGTWMMDSIANAILLTSTHGKYLLSQQEKNSGIAFASLLGLALACLIAFLVTNSTNLLWLSIAAFAALVPVPRSFLEISKNRKYFGLLAGIVMLGLISYSFMVFAPSFSPTFAIIITLVAYTWISNLIK